MARPVRQAPSPLRFSGIKAAPAGGFNTRQGLTLNRSQEIKMKATREFTPSQQQRQARSSLKTMTVAGTSVATSRKTSWIVSASAPRTADDLSFTSRDDGGRIVWWDVTPPRTDYWHVHYVLGRAYAFEVLDLLNNPGAAKDQEKALGFILAAIARWLPGVAGTAAAAIGDGFFGVVSEYVATGTATR